MQTGQGHRLVPAAATPPPAAYRPAPRSSAAPAAAEETVHLPGDYWDEIRAAAPFLASPPRHPPPKP